MKLEPFSNFMRNFCAYCWLAGSLICAYFLYRIDDVPVQIQGYRIGADNIVYPGQPNEGLVLLKRNIKRDCDVRITINVQSKDRVWAGEVFSQQFSYMEVRWAEKTTPGQFIFPLRIPDDLPPGPAMLGAKAEFKCYDNPFHKFTKSTADITQLIPITVGE